MSEWSLGAQLLLATGAFDALILSAVIIARLLRARQRRGIAWMRHFMRVAFAGASTEQVARLIERDADAFLQQYMELEDSIQLPDDQHEKIQTALVTSRRFPKLVHQLRSKRRYIRTRAAIWLGYAAPTDAVLPLVSALERETKPSVRLHIAHSLVRLGNPAVVPSIVDTLAGSDALYQERVRGLLFTFGSDFTDYFPILRDRSEPEILTLTAHIAATIGTEDGRYYLTQLLQDPDRDTRVRAAELLLDAYIYTVDPQLLLRHEDVLIVNLAVEALGRLRSFDALDTLIETAGDERTRKSAVVGLSNLVHDTPRLFNEFIRALRFEQDERRRDALLEVVSQRVEYLLERLLRRDEPGLHEALRDLVASGRSSGVISFLNRNTDPGVESQIVDLIGDVVRSEQRIQEEFARHAADSVINRIGIDRKDAQHTRGERVGEATHPAIVLATILGVVLIPPLAFFVVRLVSTAGPPQWQWAALYLNRFEMFFGRYAFVLNMIYLTLLGFAAYAVDRQERYLALKPLSLLFRPAMLPSISIIVPAFGEESTIVENVNSLLNLRYPDFEVIVVNDGSSDHTLDVLVKHFELERTDVFIHGYLGTQPIRGVYRNPQIPELMVIDKQNGGKADSLNAGINAARKRYFAAIDSDSLLERDSLLRLAGGFLDIDVPVVASGGNIFPVNGCTVDRGQLDEIRLPKNLLARFQTLEYIRSFMAGRTGWAQLGALMIISGAFGLFRKQDVVDAHGYLTGSGFFSKDTVAEDMELVVRVARTLRERGTPFAVHYAYSANCWTEVPTTHRILRNQRDRWQRGLIDTMYFHINMLFNPKHRQMGMIGYPYYFFFELLGPWIEAQGLLFLAIGLLTGSVGLPVFLLVMAATVGMGVGISLASLLLAEYHQQYFSAGDRIRLILLAIVENFGYRQYSSLMRLRGYISALTKKTGWGTMVRAGFAGNKQGTK